MESIAIDKRPVGRPRKPKAEHITWVRTYATEGEFAKLGGKDAVAAWLEKIVKTKAAQV